MQSTYTILVCEDEQFQRLALIEQLDLCNYRSIACENGREALKFLRCPSNQIDLVLLDLIMPEVNGFEVLEQMRSDPALAKIPVVVMSANETNEMVAQAVHLGAQNYLVKPIRMAQVKFLEAFIKMEIVSPKRNGQGLDRFEKIRMIGKGGSAVVWLMKYKDSGREVAMKEIDLKHLSPEDQRNALTELELMKLIQGPTIVKFIESFQEDDRLFIVMEYAEGGSLAQKIKLQEVRKTPFTEDQILAYLSQLILSLQMLHSKQIVHRDIKTLNIFVKDDILKLGDFGISKLLENTLTQGTAIGTPYYMAPEVILGKRYGTKADIWSLGVVLYELIALKKPFNGVGVKQLFENITEHPLTPLPEGVSPSFKMLVQQMLDKNPTLRPTISEIAKLPFVRKRILEFIKDHQCEQDVLPYFEFEPTESSSSSGPQTSKLSMGTPSGTVIPFQQSDLEDYADEMRMEIPIKHQSASWLGKRHPRCALGKDIFNWLAARFNKRKAALYCQEMLENQLIVSVEEDADQIFEIQGFFRFRPDRTDIADNLVKQWAYPARPPLQVSKTLVQMAIDLYEKAIFFDQEINIIDSEVALKSEEYKRYMMASAELAKVEFASLPEQEKTAIFLNVYQAMYVHYFLRRTVEETPEASDSILDQVIHKIFSPPPKSFYYDIGGFKFSLKQIKHGLLRNNLPDPETGKVTLEDERLELLQGVADPRINFVCLDYPQHIEHIEPIEGSSAEALEQSLAAYADTYLNAKVLMESKIVQLPKLMSVYFSDFGGSAQRVIAFTRQYVEQDPGPVEQIVYSD